MSKTKTPFESPASPPLESGSILAARSEEPVLDVQQIQGNIFPGFNKDHQTLLFLKIDDPVAFAIWLGKFADCVATTEDVLAFNRLFKSLRRKQFGNHSRVKSSWANIAFSFAGLKKLEKPSMNLDEFADTAFTQGLLARAVNGELGDPVGSGKAGDPKNWVVGGTNREADVVLIFAADDRNSLNDEVAYTVTTLFPSTNINGELVASGASLLFRQDGDVLREPLVGHEHFGFKDGVSQPGIRGILPDGTPLTPSQNPLNPGQGKPGQDLIWPGEFVFGYPGQDPKKAIDQPGKDPLKNKNRKAPGFARNGSFLVFRRLQQDVGGFHRFLGQLGKQFRVTPALAGARMVGRWPSGAPTVISPTVDDPDLARDDCRNNNFEFGAEDNGSPTQPVKLPGKVCENVSPPAHDPLGLGCPFAGHIRKSYPRDDESETIPSLNESTTQTHRLLRRGIPYGPQSASAIDAPVDDGVDRGLLFLAYQVSIVDQFEFVTKNWVNNPDFKDGGTGFDPIIGQNGADASRRRTFRLGLPGETAAIETDQDWVSPTGGGYYFAPSIDALRTIAGLESEKYSSKSTKSKPKKKK